MSRQRIRTGVLESSTIPCAICGGTGHVRSVSSVALHLLRSLEEQLIKNSGHDLVVRTKSDVALYLLNQKRAHLRELEQRFGVNILIQADAALSGQQYFAVDRGPPARPPVAAPVSRVSPDSIAPAAVEDEEEDIEAEADAEADAEEESEAGDAQEHGREQGEQEDGEQGRGRRRRRRRRGRGRGREGQEHAPFGEERPHEPRQHAERQGEFGGSDDDEGDEMPAQANNGGGEHRQGDDGNGGQRRRRRRGRRGGRRNRRDRGEHGEHRAQGGEEGGQQHTGHTGEQFETAGDPFRSITEPAAEQRYEEPSPAPERAPEPEPQPEAEPRRKSTVRERFFGRSDPAPEEPAQAEPAQPQPANGDSEPISPDRPRRAGWWNRGR
jgi:ribonuclease E